MLALVIQRINPETISVWELLPLDLIKLIIVQSRNTVMFRVCKLFNSYSNDEDFWKNYAMIVSNNEFPPKHYKQDSRVATPLISSWKSYVRARIIHNKSYAPQPNVGARKRILVPLFLQSFPNVCVKKELKDIGADPPEGISASPRNENNIMHWIGAISGPKGTPYEGGIFFVDIKFPVDYPFKPPKIVFTTKIYHCGINTLGNHCLNTLMDGWSPAITVARALMNLSSMIANPEPDDPIHPEIAKMYKNDRQQHDKIAKEWTKKYAM